MSAPSKLLKCPACGIDRVSTSFVGKVCNFCDAAGLKPPKPERVLTPRRKTGLAKEQPKDPAPAQPLNLNTTAEDAYTPPQFDSTAARAAPNVELAARTLARRRLLPFIKRFRPKYDAGWVHEDICRRLERFMKDVEDGLEPRLLLLCPPRAGKSEIGSRHFPAWVLGHHPDWEIIAASNAMTLALSFSRYIRDLLRDPAYHSVFPDTMLDPQSQSTENWNLLNGGGYLAAGIGSAIVGRGAHILCIDDVVRDMEAADSQTQRDATWEWYITTAHSRLAPGGGVLGILCMTGDTPVLMADGTERRLDTLTVSDKVATYANGELKSSVIKGVKSNGRDSILKITTSSGKVVRANQRHPFLATTLTGELKWIRARSLSIANRIVTVRDSGGNGKALPALQMDVTGPPSAEGYVTLTTAKNAGQTGTKANLTGAQRSAIPNSNTNTASLAQITSACSASKTGDALSAEDRQVTSANPIIGKHDSLSITATIQTKSEGCSATDATQESDILGLSPWHLPQPNTSDFMLEEILSVEPDGVEEVFDVQVECTENFIANGVVSHNTWWHEDDWAGRIQSAMEIEDEFSRGERFEIVKYPAINDQGDEYILEDDTIVQIPSGCTVPEGARLTRVKNTALHPARYSYAALMRKKANYIGAGLKRMWDSLYQQNPTPDEGIYFSKKMFQHYVHQPQTHGRFIYQAWDFAITTGELNDWTVGTTILQDEYDNLYVLDVLRFRSDDGNEIVETILDYQQQWEAQLLGFEDGQIWKTLASQFKKRCEERKVYPAYELLVPLTDKMVRANPLKGRMQLGKVYFPKNASWYPVMEREMLRFPAGKHDDQVDSLAWCVRLTLSRSAPTLAQAKPLASWKDKLKATGRRGGSAMAA